MDRTCARRRSRHAASRDRVLDMLIAAEWTLAIALMVVFFLCFVPGSQ